MNCDTGLGIYTTSMMIFFGFGIATHKQPIGSVNKPVSANTANKLARLNSNDAEMVCSSFHTAKKKLKNAEYNTFRLLAIFQPRINNVLRRFFPVIKWEVNKGNIGTLNEFFGIVGWFACANYHANFSFD